MHGGEMDAREWIGLMLEKAEGLRKAGLSSVTCEGFSAELRPPEPPEPPMPSDEGEDEDEDELLQFRRYRSRGSNE